MSAWKLAENVDLRADKTPQWGRQRLRQVLESIVHFADTGGGKVVVVDAVDARQQGLLAFHLRNGFGTLGIKGNLPLCMKVSSDRNTLMT